MNGIGIVGSVVIGLLLSLLLGRDDIIPFALVGGCIVEILILVVEESWNRNLFIIGNLIPILMILAIAGLGITLVIVKVWP